MDKFGKTAIRALESFGVAGLLEERCKVYYENLFSTRQIGRVSDLIFARVKESGSDELSLRAALLFGAFQAFGSQAPDQPASFEFGIDSEKIGISFSFVLTDESLMEPTEILGRIQAGEPTGSFEVLATRLLEHCHRVVLRSQAGSQRFEVVGLIGIPGKMDPGELGQKHTVHWVRVPSKGVLDVPVRSYTELGDLDYEDLLADDSPKSRVGKSPTGEFLVRAFDEGGSDEDQTVSGVTDVRTDESIRVSGESAERVQDYGDGGGSETSSKAPSDSHRNYLEKITKLQKRVRDLEDELASQQESVTQAKSAATSLGPDSVYRSASDLLDTAADSELPMGGTHEARGISRFFKKVWPFVRKESPPTHVSSPETEVTPTALDTAEPNLGVKEVEAAQVFEGSLESVARGFVSEFQSGGIANTINRLSREANAVKNETQNAKAKLFIEKMMNELTTERGRLQEVGNALVQTLRQKELEGRQREILFRNQERTMQADIRTKERTLRHKEYTIVRMKNLAVQSGLKIERLKTQASAAIAAAKSKPASAELTALQLKFDQVAKQLDEQNKMNHLLTERVSDAQKNRDHGSGNANELKVRLEASIKVVRLGKKHNDHLTAQLESMRREETRLKMELNKASSELARLKTGRRNVA